jgi:hypothetical protein
VGWLLHALGKQQYNPADHERAHAAAVLPVHSWLMGCSQHLSCLLLLAAACCCCLLLLLLLLLLRLRLFTCVEQAEGLTQPGFTRLDKAAECAIRQLQQQASKKAQPTW